MLNIFFNMEALTHKNLDQMRPPEHSVCIRTYRENLTYKNIDINPCIYQQKCFYLVISEIHLHL